MAKIGGYALNRFVDMIRKRFKPIKKEPVLDQEVHEKKKEPYNDKKYRLILLSIMILIYLWISWVLWIYLLYVLFVILVVWYTRRNAKIVSPQIIEHSTLIAGAKGNGKDLLLQTAVDIYYKKDTEGYISNMDYGSNYVEFEYKKIDLSPNTYENMINGDIHIVKKYDELEGKNLILSDIGIYFPNIYDGLLSNKYKSMPLFIAISRQLYNMNVIGNTQAIGRPWKKLKEHFDRFIQVKRTFPANSSKGQQRLHRLLPVLRKHLITWSTIYDKYESAEAKLLPFKKTGLVSKNNVIYSTTPDTIRQQYLAENGLIREYMTSIKIKDIKYDTREFHKKFFGYKYGDPKPSENKKSVN